MAFVKPPGYEHYEAARENGSLYIDWNSPLGQGGQAIVYKGAVINPCPGLAGKPRDCAVKAFNISKLLTPKAVQQFNGSKKYITAKNEYTFFTKFGQHKNIVDGHTFSMCAEDSCIRTIKGDTYGYFLLPMELCDSDLYELLEQQEPGGTSGLSYFDRKCLLHDIARGIAHIHKGGHLIRDIKPKNVLIKLEAGSQRYTAKLADFAEHKETDQTISAMTGDNFRAAGTNSYMAPEYAPGIQAHGAIDIFSMGIIAYELLAIKDTHQRPHPFRQSAEERSEDLQENIKNGAYSPDWLDKLLDDDVEARNLVASMLQREATARPTAQEVLEHPFFWTPKERAEHMERLTSWLRSGKGHGVRSHNRHAQIMDRLFNLQTVTGVDNWSTKLPTPFIDRALASQTVRVLAHDSAEHKQRAALKARQLSHVVTNFVRNMKSHYEELTAEEKESVLAELNLGDDDDEHHHDLNRCAKDSLLDQFALRTLNKKEVSYQPEYIYMYIHLKFPSVALCLLAAQEYTLALLDQLPMEELWHITACTRLFLKVYSTIVESDPPQKQPVLKPIGLLSKDEKRSMGWTMPVGGNMAITTASSVRMLQPPRQLTLVKVLDNITEDICAENMEPRLSGVQIDDETPFGGQTHAYPSRGTTPALSEAGAHDQAYLVENYSGQFDMQQAPCPQTSQAWTAVLAKGSRSSSMNGLPPVQPRRAVDWQDVQLKMQEVCSKGSKLKIEHFDKGNTAQLRLLGKEFGYQEAIKVLNELAAGNLERMNNIKGHISKVIQGSRRYLAVIAKSPEWPHGLVSKNIEAAIRNATQRSRWLEKEHFDARLLDNLSELKEAVAIELLEDLSVADLSTTLNFTSYIMGAINPRKPY